MMKRLIEITNPVFVVASEPDTTVREVSETMAERSIGAVAVCEGDRIVGIFSERDLLSKVVAKGKDPDLVLVEDVMTSPVVTASEDTPVLEGLEIMLEGRFRHLPLLGEHGQLVGIVSLRDLLKYCAEALAPRAKEPRKRAKRAAG